jgi:hypothetical protein
MDPKQDGALRKPIASADRASGRPLERPFPDAFTVYARLARFAEAEAALLEHRGRFRAA